MVAPLLADLAELDRLEFDRSGEWFRRYQRQLEVFVAGAGKFGVSHFILIDGLNFVFELIGATRTYLALDECPEQVRRAIDFALRAQRGHSGSVLRARGALAGGTASNSRLAPRPHRLRERRSVPHDVGRLFRKVGPRAGRTDPRPLRRRRGAHPRQWPAFARSGGDAPRPPRRCSLATIAATPAAFDVLADLQARTGDLPLVVQANYAPFVERLRRRPPQRRALSRRRQARALPTPTRSWTKSWPTAGS